MPPTSHYQRIAENSSNTARDTDYYKLMKRKITDFPKNTLLVPLSSGFSADTRTLIGIFDLDTSTKSPDTRRFLRLCEKKGKLSTDSKDLPKSFAVCDGYITLLQTASNQLAKKFG